MVTWTFLVAIILVKTSIVFAEKTEVSYKLPNIYEFIAYDLHLTFPDEVFTLDKSVFNGSVLITLKLTEVPDYIVLHANDDFINIKNITFNDLVLPKEYFQVDRASEILRIKTPYPLVQYLNQHLLIHYEGLVNDNDLFGLYRSSYFENGTTSYVLATQFAPFYARRVCPCFDEPGFKSTFSVSVTFPAHMSATFNTPASIERQDVSLKHKTIQFEPAKNISTYTLALNIDNFNCTKSESSPTFKICSRKSTFTTREFTLDLGKKLLDSYSSLTGYDYGRMMSKMDVIAVPDFFSGGMENWGLVNGRETDLLWDPKLSSEKNKQRIAQTVAHEFSHQWFGNLVTMKSWSELYLSEGFGTYFEYFGLEKLFPDWKMEGHFVLEQIQRALEEDASESALALESACETEDDIVAKFGPISYSKGAAVLRMVRYFMGSERFVAGLRSYLQKHEYSSVTSIDLLEALDSAVDQTFSMLPADLPTVMNNWITEPGYPIIDVTLSGDSVTIYQTSSLSSEEKRNTKWYVPISYTTSADTAKFITKPRFWVTPYDQAQKLAKLQGSNSWIILNNNQIGYYRVNYDHTLWDRLTSALEKEDFDGISEINRAQIIDDLFFLAKHRKISYTRVFRTTNFLKRDTSYFSWASAIKEADYVLSTVDEESESGQGFKLTLLLHLERIYRSIPFDPEDSEDHLTAVKRDAIFTFACKLGYLHCIEEVQKRFKNFVEKRIRPHRDLRSLVYCNGIRYSENVKDWDFLWNQYESNVTSEQEAILSGLACTKDPSLLKRLLLKTIDDSTKMRAQDAWTAFSSIYRSSSEGVDAAVVFFAENYNKIVEKYKSMLVIGDLLVDAASRVTNDQSLASLMAFVEEANKMHKEIAPKAEEAVKSAETNLKMIRNCKSDINKYFYNTACKSSVSNFLGLFCIAFCIVRLF